MAQQKFTLKLDKRYSSEVRKAIGEEVIDFIINRTQEGLDKNNKEFTGQYSKSYMKSLDFKLGGKSSKINLTLSGEMLNALEVLNDRSGAITIGIPKGDTFNNDKAEGNIKGTYGQKKPIPGKQRDFMGIAKDDLKDILKKYPLEKDGPSPTAILNAFELLVATEAGEELSTQFFGGFEDGI